MLSKHPRLRNSWQHVWFVVKKEIVSENDIFVPGQRNIIEFRISASQSRRPKCWKFYPNQKCWEVCGALVWGGGIWWIWLEGHKKQKQKCWSALFSSPHWGRSRPHGHTASTERWHHIGAAVRTVFSGFSPHCDQLLWSEPNTHCKNITFLHRSGREPDCCHILWGPDVSNIDSNSEISCLAQTEKIYLWLCLLTRCCCYHIKWE